MLFFFVSLSFSFACHIVASCDIRRKSNHFFYNCSRMSASVHERNETEDVERYSISCETLTRYIHSRLIRVFNCFLFRFLIAFLYPSIRHLPWIARGTAFVAYVKLCLNEHVSRGTMHFRAWNNWCIIIVHVTCGPRKLEKWFLSLFTLRFARKYKIQYLSIHRNRCIMRVHCAMHCAWDESKKTSRF